MVAEGHTVALFPEGLVLHETHRWLVANWVEKFKTYRITIAFPVLHNAREVILSAAGSANAQLDKAAASQLSEVNA